MRKVKSKFTSRLRHCFNEFKGVFTYDGKSSLWSEMWKICCNITAFSNSGALRWKQAYRCRCRLRIIGHVGSHQFWCLLLQVLQEPPNFPRLWHVCKAFVSSDIPLFKINTQEDRHELSKCTHRDPPEEETAQNSHLTECYEETLSSILVFCGRKYLGVHIRNNRCRWKEGFKYCYWGFEKRPNTIREIMSSHAEKCL
jgi:hypothetical protein